MRPRIDPRRPALRAPNGRRRIVLGGSEGERTLGAMAHAVARAPRSSGPYTQRLAVLAACERGQVDDAGREALAAAALLAAPDTEVVLITTAPCTDDAAALGADRVFSAPLTEDAYAPEAGCRWLAALHQRLCPRHWLAADAGVAGDWARRLALAQALPAACGVVELTPTRLRQRAGAAHDVLRPHAPVMLLARGVADTALGFTGLAVTDAQPWPEAVPAAVTDLGLAPADAQQVALDEADFILAAGNGVRDVALFHQLARALGAAVGASRVAVDDGRFARSQQIGATGQTVQASAYLALGISGAVQHLQGIKACRHVIAVNLDASAPIAQRAELMVIEDSGAFMQALLALAQQGRAP